MINIVTWLENNDVKNELSVVCAGNGIRIVEDKFENAQDFLMKFDAIDTNIDVLVIADRNLENTDKKSFFEEVCVTEPNIRIVIVFPGYRNEYIEEQIAVWAALGQISVEGTDFTEGRATLAKPTDDIQKIRTYEALWIILYNASFWDRPLNTGMGIRLGTEEAGNVLDIEHKNGLIEAEETGSYGMIREI